MARERRREIGFGPLALAPAAPAARGCGRPDHPPLARGWWARTPGARMSSGVCGAVYFLALMASNPGRGGRKVNRVEICGGTPFLVPTSWIPRGWRRGWFAGWADVLGSRRSSAHRLRCAATACPAPMAGTPFWGLQAAPSPPGRSSATLGVRFSW